MPASWRDDWGEGPRPCRPPARPTPAGEAATTRLRCPCTRSPRCRWAATASSRCCNWARCPRAAAFNELQGMTLGKREEIIAAFRAAMRQQGADLARQAWQETGLGRYEDKVIKNRLVTDKTPGTEALKPDATSGDHGLTLTEWAPFRRDRRHHADHQSHQHHHLQHHRHGGGGQCGGVQRASLGVALLAGHGAGAERRGGGRRRAAQPGDGGGAAHHRDGHGADAPQGHQPAGGESAARAW